MYLQRYAVQGRANWTRLIATLHGSEGRKYNDC